MFRTVRQMKFQREADPEWAGKIRRLPGCERLFSCIQCGTCSGTCPLSIYMDYTPRRIINLAREGFRQVALSSQTIWLCASCYACTVHCPQNIHITDVMYSLKREAIRSHLYPKRLPIPILAQEFYNMVKRRGRTSELWLMFRLGLKTNPLMLLSFIGVGWKLLRTGRLSLSLSRVGRIKEVRDELASPGEAA